MNKAKSTLFAKCPAYLLIMEIATIFNVVTNDLESGFRYLGFNLKTNKYCIGDWD